MPFPRVPLEAFVLLLALVVLPLTVFGLCCTRPAPLRVKITFFRQRAEILKLVAECIDGGSIAGNQAPY